MGSNDGSSSQGHAPLPPPRLPAPGPAQPLAPLPPSAPGAVSPQHTPGPERRRTGLIAAAVGVAVAAVVAVVLVVGGGDDERSSAPTSSAEVAATTSTVPNTEPAATLPVLTAPTVPVTSVPGAVSPWEGVDVVGVSDDAGVFTLTVPVDWAASTESRTIFGATAAGISAAPDLAAYRAADDAVGVTAAVMLSDDVGSAGGLASSYLDGVDACVEEDWQSGHSTVLGDAELLLLDGCGTGGMYAKTVLVVETFGLTVLVAVQGLGPADGDLLVLAQAFIDTLVLL